MMYLGNICIVLVVTKMTTGIRVDLILINLDIIA